MSTSYWRFVHTLMISCDNLVHWNNFDRNEEKKIVLYCISWTMKDRDMKLVSKCPEWSLLYSTSIHLYGLQQVFFELWGQMCIFRWKISRNQDNIFSAAGHPSDINIFQWNSVCMFLLICLITWNTPHFKFQNFSKFEPP